MKISRIVALPVVLLGAVGFAIVLMNSWSSGSRGAELPLAAVPNASAGDQTESAARELPGPGPAPSLPRREVMHATASREGLDVSGGTPAGSGEPPRAATLAELQEFRVYVDTTLSEIRKEQATDKLRDIEKRVARMDDVILELDDLLTLNSRQSERMRSALLSRLDLEAEYLRKWERGMDEGILGELMASDRAAHVAELSEFLTGEQLQTYLSRKAGAGK